MVMPKLTQLAPNFSRLDWGDLTVWFSYETPVGFQKDGPPVVSENLWSNTTGKYLNRIGPDRVERGEFERLFSKVVQ